MTRQRIIMLALLLVTAGAVVFASKLGLPLDHILLVVCALGGAWAVLGAILLATGRAKPGAVWGHSALASVCFAVGLLLVVLRDRIGSGFPPFLFILAGAMLDSRARAKAKEG